MNAIKSLAAVLLLLGSAHGFQSLESTYRLTGAAVVAAFEAQRAVLQRSSAVMLDGREEIAYGIVISADGHVLTKASEIAGIGNLSVRVDQQSYHGAQVVAVDDEWDVALVKIEATGLSPVDFASSSSLPD